MTSSDNVMLRKRDFSFFQNVSRDSSDFILYYTSSVACTFFIEELALLEKASDQRITEQAF